MANIIEMYQKCIKERPKRFYSLLKALVDSIMEVTDTVTEEEYKRLFRDSFGELYTLEFQGKNKWHFEANDCDGSHLYFVSNGVKYKKAFEELSSFIEETYPFTRLSSKFVFIPDNNSLEITLDLNADYKEEDFEVKDGYLEYKYDVVNSSNVIEWLTLDLNKLPFVEIEKDLEGIITYFEKGNLKGLPVSATFLIYFPI